MEDDAVTLQPVEGNPFTDPMSGATVPQLAAGGRGVGRAAYGVASIPMRAFDASENLRLGGMSSDEPSYNPEAPITAASMMIGVGAPFAEIGALGAAGGKIKFDPKTISSGTPLYGDKVVMNVDPKALNAAYRATDPEFANNLMPGRTQRLEQFVDAGNAVSMPEVGVNDGRLGFTNGRHRAQMAADQGLDTMPIAVDKENVGDVQALLHNYQADPNAPFPQYATEYPPVGPGELRVDKGSGKPYMGKQLTPEAQDFADKRAAIIEDMDKNGYQPYFDESQRFHVEPKNYPPMLDTAQNLPAKRETLEQWTQKIDAPETRALLQQAYKEGQTIPNAQNWYMMGQLEREYVNELGPEAGRAAFRNEFGGSMAATTGGADPTSNFLMAHYGNFMRAKGQDFPRVTPGENQQVKEFSEGMGRPYVNAKGQPIDKTGDIASYKLPYPIGGQYAAGNLDQFQKISDAVSSGKDIATALQESNPKRLDFMQAFTGNPDSFVWDNQMTSHATSGMDKPMQMPVKGTYGIFERVGREEAAKAGVPAQNFQDVGWAGIKKMKEGSGDEDYAGPMIGHVNRAIERTHQLTGVPRQTILRQGIIRKQMPVYGMGGLSIGALSNAVRQRQEEDQQ